MLSTEKLSSSLTPDKEPLDPFQGLSFQVGVAENKNATYRAKMEDVHTYVANFAERLDWGYFAIFDGHAGKLTARWCGNNLHTLVEHEIMAKEAATTGAASPSHLCDIKDVFNTAFVKADALIEQEGSGSAGCTAAVAILRWESDREEMDPKQTKAAKATKAEGNAEGKDEAKAGKADFDFVPAPHHRRMLHTSNVGDLRIVLCRNGKAFRLTYDHKASDENEMARVRELGGLIVKNRVNGVLAITRSLGDSYIKNLVTGKPFTTSTEITADDDFLILACDGVWDVVSDAVACKFVHDVFRQQEGSGQACDPAAAAKKLCKLAIDKATTDNVTVMVVKLDAKVFPPRD